VLQADVARYLEGAHVPARLAHVSAIITPHAGLAYSGPVAGLAWGAARMRRPARIVLIGPAHRVGFWGLALGDFEAFAIPTGLVQVDRGALASLEDAKLAAFVPYAHDAEHSLEIELPFAHALFPGTPIVPLLVGEASCEDIVAVLGALVRPDDLVVVSSDLSHFHPYDVARLRDEATLEHITHLDAAGLDGHDACGYLGVQALARFAQGRGEVAVRLDYRNSGDTAGDRRAVVGYGAVAFGPHL
jgi:hypothetical protein